VRAVRDLKQTIVTVKAGPADASRLLDADAQKTKRKKIDRPVNNLLRSGG
jgi:hypothetical protein